MGYEYTGTYSALVQLALLELFVTVVEQGGMTAAGRELGMTQPAVSRSIANLERQLGVALFRRNGRQVETTEAGMIAYDKLSVLMGDWHRIRAELRQLGGRPDQVTIAVPFGTARVLIPVLVRRAAAAVSDIMVNVVEQASPDSLAAVARHEYAMALVYPDADDPPADLTAVATERLYAIGTPALLGSESGPIAIDELAELPLLLSEPSWSIRRTIDRAFAEHGIEPRVVREVGIAEVLMAFAIEGDGVTILPLSNVVRERELGTLAARAIDDPTIERDLALVTSSELSLSAAADLTNLFRSAIDEIAPTTRWQLL